MLGFFSKKKAPTYVTGFSHIRHKVYFGLVRLQGFQINNKQAKIVVLNNIFVLSWQTDNFLR